jgi:seryl-tRNA synthetase
MAQVDGLHTQITLLKEEKETLKQDILKREEEYDLLRHQSESKKLQDALDELQQHRNDNGLLQKQVRLFCIPF